LNPIKFGTSGWRAVICEDFTFVNVKRVVQAIASYLISKGSIEKGVVVGNDSRFFGERFSKEAVKVFAANGIHSYLCKGETPTPVIAYTIMHKKCLGGINFTASHNPPEYSGIKFSLSSGGPALPDDTKEIEQLANQKQEIKEISLEEAIKNNLITEINPKHDYFNHLKTIVDLAVIKHAKLKIAFDPMYGAARGYLDEFLWNSGIDVNVLHDYRDVYFGGIPPDPSDKNLEELKLVIKDDRSISLGLATDGDADRFGIIDKDGAYIEPNKILALLLDYLLGEKGYKDGVARSVATSHLIDYVAKFYGVNVTETAVGFKYLGELITAGKVAMGGEESAGFSMKGHVPEKDGILACLLTLELVSKKRNSLRQLLEELYGRVGRLWSKREDIHLTDEIKKKFIKKTANPPETLESLKVYAVDMKDGLKLYFSKENWLLFRVSGTEPVVRVYAEAKEEKELEKILKAGKNFLFS